MTFNASAFLIKDRSDASINLQSLAGKDLDAWLRDAPAMHRHWVLQNQFKGKKGEVLPLPSIAEGASTQSATALIGTENGALIGEPDPWGWALIADQLPAGDYVLPDDMAEEAQAMAAFGWALAHYNFDWYRSQTQDMKIRRLVIADDQIREQASHLAQAVCFVRDMVNVPANDMLPSHLEETARTLAETHGAQISSIIGDALLAENFPAIHAVGRASTDAPRLLDLRWGNPNAPKVTLVGKGVCFDSGGLDIKPASGMRLMKKDMGGAAHALGLAQLIMASKQDICLRVLIPAVENAISGNAFRPGDIIQTRKGLSVEIGNTDAEGRLVLADALTLACEESPDLLIDFATLTGAARIALGPDLPAFFTHDHGLADRLQKAAVQTGDPIWRLPLWTDYLSYLDSGVADIANAGDTPFAGSITAALFLDRFVQSKGPWVHFDVYAWNQKARPGRPAGGEAMGIRATFDAICNFLSKP